MLVSSTLSSDKTFASRDSINFLVARSNSFFCQLCRIAAAILSLGPFRLVKSSNCAAHCSGKMWKPSTVIHPR